MFEKLFSTITPLPITADGLKAVQVESFFVWKKNLLRKIKFADIGVKIFLLLPYLLPVFCYYYFTSSRPTLKGEFLRLILPPLFISLPSFFFVYIEINKLFDTRRKAKVSAIDWSKKKFQELAHAATAAGLNISETIGKLEVVDRWHIEIYQRPRNHALGFLLGLCGFCLSLIFMKYEGIGLNTKLILLSLFIAITLGVNSVAALLRVFDVFIPRLELLITSRALTYLRGEPTKLRLLISHEFSHEKHRDPLKKLIWKVFGEVPRIYLFLLGFLLSLILIKSPHLAVQKIVLLIALLICIVCWSVAIVQVQKLIPLFQELRADLDAVNSSSDCEVLTELLIGLPVEFELDSILRKFGPLKATAIRFRRRYEIKLNNERKEQRKNRIEMLTTGSISLINNSGLSRTFLFAYGSVLISLTTIYTFLSK
jgi:Zn-dependent protease with chaperone function